MWNNNLFAVLMFLTTCHSKPSEVIDEIRLPEECKYKRFCTVKPDGYELLVEKMDSVMKQFIKENTSMKVKRSMPDEVHVSTAAELTLSAGTQPSMLSPQSDWHNCPYETTRTPLYTISYLNEDKVNSELVVQTEENRQIFDIVTCAHQHIPNSESQCFQDLPLKQLGMKSTCETVYAQRRIYVYDVKQEKIGLKYFQFPVACQCRLSNKP